MRILVALGGNALTTKGGDGGPDDQMVAVGRASVDMAALLQAGHDLLITHGNGPQVGRILVKNELATHVFPPIPLDWCGASTQGTIGFRLMNAMEAALMGFSESPDAGLPPEAAETGVAEDAVPSPA